MPYIPSASRPEIIPDPRTEAIAQNLERLAWLMDRALPIPGTKIRIGLDALLGLFPGAGDFVTGLVQTGLVLTALKHYRVPKQVAAKMAANVLLDYAVGTIPLLGDLFDVGFKANTRNMKLLGEVRHLQSQGQAIPAKSSIWYIFGIAAILLIPLLILFVGLVALAAVTWKSING